MTELRDTFVSLVGARPVGSDANNRAVGILQQKAQGMGYETTLLPITCRLWEPMPSLAERGGVLFTVNPCPFSKPFDGVGEVVSIHSVEELRDNPADLSNKILILSGEAAKDPLMPKNFPFYYPDEHKRIIDSLEAKRPSAVIAVTGRHPMCGLNPFPLFEDGNFSIPSAYIAKDRAEVLLSISGPVRLRIGSETKQGRSNQLIAAKKGKDPVSKKIVICAHLDTKYGTPGALDNGSGIAVLAGMMKRLQDYGGPFTLEFVPFNGEEYYEASGEVEYLKRFSVDAKDIGLVVNMDSPGYKESPVALSYYNFSDSMTEALNYWIENKPCFESGSPWYAGDHSMFAYRGIPCLVATSGGLLENVLRWTHTPEDTVDHIDLSVLEKTADFLAEVVETMKY